MTSPERLMDIERWQIVVQIFLEALEREPADRARFLLDAVHGDDVLRQEVEGLIASHAQADTFMEVPAVRASDVLLPLALSVDAVGHDEQAPEPRPFRDYQLLGEIARGGMGVVFKARQIGLNRIVALKTIVGGAQASPMAIQRFRTEAEAAAALTHPNIVPIYEIGEHDGQQYFTMRLLEGGSLQQHLDDYMLLPDSSGDHGIKRSDSAARQARIARLVEKVARAVHYAHQHGVLHRDLKPANILLDETGEPFVADFGIAKLLDGNRDTAQSMTVIGTPSYMSPEQCAGGTTSLTTVTDVFSLGAILYQLLTGRPPFQAATPVATMQQVIEQEPPAIRSLNRSVDSDLETISIKCLNKDPQRRYASAEVVADDLDRWLAGEPIAARPVTQLERVWRWCVRKPVLATLWLGLASAIVIGFVVSTWQWRRAEDNASMLRANLYAADMGVAFQAWESGHIGRARELLEKQRPKPGEADLRTFEWRYMFGVTRPRELLTIKSSTDSIWGSAVSPDGHLLATGSGDGKVELWDLPNGRLSATFQAGSTIVYCVAFSPDGRLLAVAHDATDVLLWDVATRTVVAKLSDHKGPVLSVAFSRDGTTLVSMAGYPYAVETPAELTLWEVGSRRRLGTLVGHTSSVGWMNFSPDGRLLATPQGNGTILLWDLASRRVIRSLTGHQGLVICVRFSPDGELLASGGIDGTVRLWRAATGELVGTLGTHEGAVYSVAFSPHGDRLISGGIDHVAKLWDTKERRPITTFRGHVSRVFSVSYAPDGRTVATASLDGTAKIWDATGPADTDVFDRHTGNVAYVRFSADGKWLARSDLLANQVTLWDARSWKKLPPILQAAASFSPDGQLLATSAQNTVTIWDVSRTQPQARTTLSLTAPPLLEPAFSPDGRRLAVDLGAQATAVGIWDIGTQRRIALLTEVPATLGLGGYAFSPDGRQFATAYNDGRIFLWNAETWIRVQELAGHSKRVGAIAFSPDGRLLVTASDDTTVRLWDMPRGDQSVVFRGDTGEVHAVAFSPDGETLAVGSTDGLVKFWNIRTSREVGTIKAHGSVIWSLAFSPDGRMLATISVDQTMRLWRAPTLGEADR